jgi:uncharacterized membrane protein
MSASEPVPSSREFTFVGIAYGLHVTGLFLMWPGFIGIVLDYVKRRDVEGSFLESHYTWLIRTFWWSMVIGGLIVGAMLAVIVPNALLIADLARSGNYLSIPWAIIAAGVLGGTGMAVVWFWVVYRLTRGILRLSDGRGAP